MTDSDRLVSPEYLAHLREQVQDWVGHARRAVGSFCNKDAGWFWRDSAKIRENEKNPSITTTSRCYMALVYAEQCLGKSREDEDWVDWLKTFRAKFDFGAKYRFVAPATKTKADKREVLNFFETAHLADLLFTLDVAIRFRRLPDAQFKGLTYDILLDALTTRLDTYYKQKSTSIAGQFPFEESGPSARSYHYFVSLHCLRALRILGADDPHNKAIPQFTFGQNSQSVRQFCIEQCYNSNSRLPHCQDSIQLAFAHTIHSLYAQPVQSDLCESVVGALEMAQQANGTWPATHPIFRGDSRRPWHITSHEVALCLTWLYFAPSIRDASRMRLIAMMERYFKEWIIPSYIESLTVNKKTVSGWYDDHHAGSNQVVGWATAIVCHFLANYCRVLNNFINRRVIESLAVQETAHYYLIDKYSTKDSRWHIEGIPTWFDLPPFAFSDPVEPKGGSPGTAIDSVVVSEYAQKNLKSEWTDPTRDEKICKALATKLITPVLRDFRQKPASRCNAIILHGPPGTRKSTLVKKIAKALRWTRITIPASVIFKDGWDLMEARASVVFRQLTYLTECIIFFDEFEEFFRERGGRQESSVPSAGGKVLQDTSAQHAGSRTLAAFTTSAMLPRVQDLRDAERSIVILATNYFQDIDKAARRSGRFSYRLEIPHPARERALQYARYPSARTRAKLGLATGAVHKKYYEPVQEVLRLILNDDESSIPFEAIEAALAHMVNHAPTGNRAREEVRRILTRKTQNDAPNLLDDDD